MKQRLHEMPKDIFSNEVVPASSWRKEPKARKGATLYKFDDGAECRSGWHEASGYPYQEYFEILGEEKPPGGREARAGRKRKEQDKIMGFYRTCPNCGANLDPGEKCNCMDKKTAQGVSSTQGGTMEKDIQKSYSNYSGKERKKQG